MVRIFQRIIQLGVISLILLPPLFYGGVRLPTRTLIECFIAFLFLCWALEIFLRQKIVLVKTPLAIPILLFCGYGLLSTLFFSRYEYASELALHQVFAFVALFFIVINHLETERDLIVLTSIIIANGLAHAILHLVKNSAGAFGTQVLGVQFSVGNHFASYLLPIIPLCISLGFVAVSQKRRILFLTVGVVISIALCFSLVAGAMLSLIVALVCIAALFGGTEPLQKKVFILSGGIGLSLFVLFWVGIEPVVNELLTVTNWEVGSPAGRVSLWKSTIKMFVASPIIGTGLGTFNYIYPMYRLPDMPGMAVYAHSDWLQLLVEQGLIGCIFIIVCVGILLRLVVRKIRRHSHLSTDFRTVLWQNGFVVGGAAASLAALVNAAVDFNLHIPAIALLFVTILAVTTVAASGRFSMRTGQIQLPRYEFALSGYLRVIFCIGAVCLWGFTSITFAKPYLAEQLSAKGRDFERQLLWESAIEQYEKAIRYAPKNADYFQRLGKAYSIVGHVSNLPKAESAYHQAIRLCPTCGDAHLALAEFYELNRHPEKAEDAYLKAVALDPNNAFYWRVVGDFYLKRGKIPAAAESYRTSLRLRPQDLAFILNRSYRLVRRSESLDDFPGIVQAMTPQNPAAHRVAADFLHQKGFTTAALDHYQSASALAPDDIGLRERIIRLLFQSGKRESALKTARIAFVDATQNIVLRKRLSHLLLQHQAHEEAVQLWKDTIALESETLTSEVSETSEVYIAQIAQLHAQLATVYAQLRRWDEAVQAYFNAAQLHHSNPDYLFRASQIYIRQGREAEAVQLWQAIVEKHPGHAAAHYQLGRFYDRREELKLAWKHLKVAIAADPANIDYRTYLAHSYYARDLYHQAIREWEAILQRYPNDVNTQLKLARVYQQIQRPDKAQQHYASVLKIQPDNREARDALNHLGGR